MKYQQLTSDERYTFSSMRKQGFSVLEIASELGRHKSTLYRELNRNRCNDNHYRPYKAVNRTNGRRSRSRKNMQFNTNDFKLISRFIRKKWSPKQISGLLHLEGILSISHETIYKYIWLDKRYGGTLYTHLRQSQKQRRKRYNAYDSRGILANKRHISERPKYINNRSTLGHWEIDTVMGSFGKTNDRHCIMTIVERKTGYTLIGKLKNRSKKTLNACFLRITKNHLHKIKTITADNGTEFHGYKDIEKRTGIKFYFATPYHSWERGTNENTNGLIRQYLPKGSSMSSISQQRCNRIAFQLNTRPRERHAFRTPLSLYHVA